MVQIVEVKTKKQMKDFVKFPLKLYKGCPYYVPSMWSDEINIMNPKKNFNLAKCDAKCFLAYKDGKIAGRVAAIIHNEANKIWNTKNVRFSRFDAIDDSEVFDALLSAVAEYGKSRGMEKISGPWGFNDSDREGMLYEGFDRRATYATNYCYPYYVENMRKLGWADESKWVEKDFTIPNQPFDRLIRLSEKLKQRLKVREVVETMPLKKILKRYADSFFETYSEAYSSLDGYVPFTGEEKKNMLKSFATIINPRYFSLLVNENDEVVAAAVVLPSIAEALKKGGGKLFPFYFIDVLKSIKKPQELEMAIIAIKKEYKNSGVHAIMMNRISKNVIDDKIDGIESNPMLETNFDIQRNWNFTESEVVKRRQTFAKPL